MSIVLEMTDPVRAMAKTGIAFEQFLRNWSEHIKREQEKLRKLVEMSVTIRRRDRGLTISDQYGGYGTRKSTEGRWMDYDPDQDGEVHPINIVADALRTNKNACLQSNSNTEVKSANQSAKHKQIALRWQRVCDYFERVTWEETKRGFVFDGLQKDGTALFWSHLKDCDSQKVPNVNESKSGIAVYNCEGCGARGMTQSDPPELSEDQNDTQITQIPCPQCQMSADAVITPLPGFDLNETPIPTYKIKTDIIPFYNFTIDTYGAKIGGIQSAKWLQIQRLIDRPELETRYSERSFASSEPWSYPLRCDYALANGDWGYLNNQNRNTGFQEFDRSEIKDIYLHESAYSNYRAPEDYEFINADGKKTFEIKANQTIAEAQAAMYGEDQQGFKFTWSDDRLLDIPDTEKEELNFRECFSEVHWSRVSDSFLSSPNYSIVTIQDGITLLNTMHMGIIARNAVNPVYVDSMAFEGADFSKEYIFSKNASLLPDGDMRKSVFSLPVPTPSPYLMQQMEFLLGIKDTIQQVTPAMRGESQKGEPYAAQRQQLETSYGGLTSVLKSFAHAKCSVFIQQAKLCKKVWTLEQFQQIASMFGEIWTEEDVEDMTQIDFDEDLSVTYRIGSEMPQSNLSKEMKFFSGLQQLMPFVQAFPQLFGTDKMTQILQKIDEIAEFEFDLTGLEVNELIAQKRYIELAEICQQYTDVTFEQIDDMRNQVVANSPPDEQIMAEAQAMAQTDPAQAQAMAAPVPIYALDLITEQIFNEAHIRFSQHEDLEQQKTFFAEMLRAEQGKPKPNYVLFETLSMLLSFMEQAIDQLNNEKMAKDPAVQAQQAEMKAQAKSEAAKNALETEKIKTAQMKIAADSANAEANRVQSDEHKQAEMVHKMIQAESEHEFQAELADKQPEEEDQPVIETIAEGIKFADLPPSGQVQVAAEAGIDITKADIAAKIKAEKSVPKPVVQPAKKK